MIYIPIAARPYGGIPYQLILFSFQLIVFARVASPFVCMSVYPHGYTDTTEDIFADVLGYSDSFKAIITVVNFLINLVVLLFSIWPTNN